MLACSQPWVAVLWQNLNVSPLLLPGSTVSCDTGQAQPGAEVREQEEGEQRPWGERWDLREVELRVASRCPSAGS